MDSRELVDALGPSDWRRIFAALSLDVFDRFATDIGFPVDAGMIRELCRTIMNAQPGLFFSEREGIFRDDARQEITASITRLFAEANHRFGSDASHRLAEWIAFVWGPLAGAMWDWFAFQMAFVVEFGPFLIEPATRDRFQRFWPHLKDLLSYDDEIKVHRVTADLVRSRECYPTTRTLPVPRELTASL